jgi:hypothetical protein
VATFESVVAGLEGRLAVLGSFLQRLDKLQPARANSAKAAVMGTRQAVLFPVEDSRRSTLEVVVLAFSIIL